MWKDRRKRILLLTALLLLMIALFWNLSLNRNGSAARLARYINNTYGYQFLPTDFYAVEDWEDTSIRLLLPGEDLTAVMAASRAAGLPSDIDRVGIVTMVVGNTPAGQVVTLFLVDGDIELGFAQWAGEERVLPLGEDVA